MMKCDAATGVTVDQVLTDVAAAQHQQLSAAASLLHAAADWADLHPGLDPDWIAFTTHHGYSEQIPLAGDGTPTVDARCIAELGAAMGRTTEAAQLLIGDALELRHRLPRLWHRVTCLRIPAWEARRVAQLTKHLTEDTVRFVDAQLDVLPRLTSSRVEHLVDAAVARHMPDLAEQQRRQAADQRRVDITPCTLNGPADGLATITGLLDLADAIDLDHALTDRAVDLARLGVDGSEGVRRSIALGDLARASQEPLDLTPDLPTTDTECGDDLGGSGNCPGQGGADTEPAEGPDHASTSSQTQRVPGRTIILNVHLSEAALTGTTEIAWLSPHSTGPLHLLDRPVLTGQIRDWCSRPDTTIVVKPVIDLNQALTAPGYQVPDRIKEHLRLREQFCIFPHCRNRRTDADHIQSYDHDHPGRGGQTSTDDLALLCRRHHRLKTFTRWRYRMIRPGCYHWTSPYGRHYLRDELSTYDLGLIPLE